MAVNLSESPTRANGVGKSTLPPGMTQEEADRLVREADERTKENTK